MRIKDKFKRKIVIRSAFCFLLSFSILLSSISISFASADAPSTVSTFDEVCPYEAAQDWVASVLEQDPNSYVMIWVRQTPTYSLHFVYVISADVSLYFDSAIQGVAASSQMGMVGKIFGSDGSSGDVTNQYPGNNSFFMDGTQYWYFNGLTVNASQIHTFYCSESFKDAGGDCEPNLDISAYLPPQYLFSAWLTPDHSLIGINVDFNVDLYDSLITIWGYDEFGPTPYTFSKNDYLQLHYDMTDRLIAEFYLPVSAFYSYYVGTEFEISSISCLGWEDGHEEWLTVDWDLTSNPDLDYNPPDSSYYYSTFYNETYNYSEQNGSVVSFGNIDICLYSDNNFDRVFWDKQKTLLAPYEFSYCFLPAMSIGDSYYDLLDELCLEFDVVIVNVSQAVFDAMYGNGAYSDFNNLLTTQDIITFFYNHFRYYELIPYEYYNDLPENGYTSYDASCLYTNSYFFKSLAYLFGDNNQLLLEFESRLLGEDGAVQTLLTSLESMYNNDFEYYTDMLVYLRKLDYLVHTLVVNDYFQKYLDELQLHTGILNDILTKLSHIDEAMTGADDEDFEDELGHPWLSFYRFFRRLFTRSLDKFGDFTDTASEILDGGSHQVSTGFYLDPNYEQNLPLENPSVTPTPYLIPNLFGGG